MPTNKFQGAMLTFVLSAAQKLIRRATRFWSCLSVLHSSDIYILLIKVLHMDISQAVTFTVLCRDLELMLALGSSGHSMPKQQHTSDWSFCQTAILHGQSRGIFVQILSVDRPLYLSLQCFVN